MVRTILAAGMFLAAVVQSLSAHEFTVGPLRIDHPYSLEVPPVSTAGAAYLAIVNQGRHPDRLLSAESPIAKSVELHTSTTVDGVMKMRKLDGVDLPSQEPVGFEPGGRHIMLLGLKRPLRAGEAFPLTLHFRDAGPAQVVVRIEPRGKASKLDHGMHQGHGSSHGEHGHGATK